MAQLYIAAESEIVKYGNFVQVDQPRLESLINASFEPQRKKLAHGYFDAITPLGIYIVGNYEAGAITTDLEGTVYVDKFFVHPEHQGNGLGRNLLRHILKDTGIISEGAGIELEHNGNSIILRADRINPRSNALYFNIFFGHFGGVYGADSSDGEHKWMVYQIGLKGEELERKIQMVADLPITMAPYKRKGIKTPKVYQTTRG